MTELLRNAWELGWRDYTSNGKFVALLLIALMLFWFVKSEIRTRYYALGVYTTVMAAFCICPFTAAMLMAYQTKFYDYQWIWNLVPMTIFIALAGTCLWTELVTNTAAKKGQRWKSIGITVVLITIVYLSGRMGNTIWKADEEAAKRQETAAVLEMLPQSGQEEICLWAPRAIMEYARALDGTILLPYGRNMWDTSLNAYTYDIYGVDENDLCAWMSNVEETGEGKVIVETQTEEHMVTEADCMDIARKLKVTHILLPDNIQPEVLAELEVHSDVAAEQLRGYYLLYIQPVEQ